MILCRLVGLAILVGLSRSTCKRSQYFRAMRPCRSCLVCRPIHPTRPMKASKSTRPRNPSTPSQPRESRLRRIRPCTPIRPSQPIHSSRPSMRIPSNRPMELPMLYILAIIVRIPTVIRPGATFRQVASVILVSLLVLTIIVSLFRLRIPSIL